MGATQAAAYLSPKQIAKIELATALSSLRRYVKDCPYSSVPKLITSNETWDFDIKFYSDIIIQPGVTLTMKCKLLMPDEAKIFIKPGGRLEIDGGTITSGCGLMWGGIEVQGDATKTQTSANQGYLVMKNGAKLENAREAVAVLNGGVIQATNATFKNNRRCAGFMSYHRPFGADINLSYFNDCTFLADAPLKDPAYTGDFGRRIGTPVFVTLWDVSRVNIRGCTFQNSTTCDVDLRSTGIYSIDASYLIDALGSGSSMNKTKFINLTKGVHAITLLTSASKYVTIKNSIFDNVQQGVQGNLSFGAIDNNIFNVPGFTGNPSNVKQWGIYLDGAKGFSITHNTFTGLSLNQSNGIIIKGSEAFGGNISFNSFTGLNIANQTEQNNQFLKISCNTYTNNNTSWSLNPLSVNGALPNQGTGCATTQARAGNTFNDVCVPTGRHIHSYLNNPFTYYAWGNPGATVPSCKIGNMYVTNCVGSTPDLTSCFEEPPCNDPSCWKALLLKMKTKMELQIKYELANRIIRSGADLSTDSTNQNTTEEVLTELNNVDAKRLLIAEKIERKDFIAARKLLDQSPNKTTEDVNFRSYYGVATDLYSKGKSFYQMDASQEKTIIGIANSETGVALNAQLALEVVKGKQISRQPEIPVTK